MTRPKVDPDKRQRTAQACDSCKRRKQKCNGLKPCNTCTRRNLECSYTPNHPEHGPDSPPKRRHIEPPATSVSVTSISDVPPISVWDNPEPSIETKDLEMKDPGPMVAANPGISDLEGPKTISDRAPREPDFDDGRSRNSTVSGQDEEAAVYTSPRMLQDSTGRLLYVGDSATLSYLQLIRMIVENIAGQSPFTLDPRRHRIMENTINLPSNIRSPHLLPDRQTADVLVESYFTNTNGLLEVFDRRVFTASVDTCYTDPLNVDPSFLCLLYLTFAIGLVFATPGPGTHEDMVIKKLRSEQFDRAELFFRSAKCLADPVSGFEDADFWSVQALLLMAVYMLAVSKRNAAYAYYGMAVRSAFALGLHRDETMVIFSPDELAVRRNLWRSLFVLDRFLSASLGRPTAISEDDCSGDALKMPERQPPPAVANFPRAATDPTVASATVGLDAAVRSCHVIGEILKKVYSRRKISTRVAQEIADKHKCWPSSLHPSLQWKHAMSSDGTPTTTTTPAHGIAILHVNLLYCHSIILLTRPFFLYLLTKVERDRASGGNPSPRISSRMEKFSEACVHASYHTIVLVQDAFERNYLPQRNPFVLYFLFAATLIVLSNEFALLYHNPSYGTCVANAISIMHYCAETDPQAERLYYILTTFRDVVATRTAAAAATLAHGATNIPPGHPSQPHHHAGGMGPGGGLTPAGMPGAAGSPATVGGEGRGGEPGMLFLHHREMPTIATSPGSTSFDPMASFFAATATATTASSASHAGSSSHEHAMRPGPSPHHHQQQQQQQHHHPHSNHLSREGSSAMSPANASTPVGTPGGGGSGVGPVAVVPPGVGAGMGAGAAGHGGGGGPGGVTVGGSMQPPAAPPQKREPPPNLNTSMGGGVQPLASSSTGAVPHVGMGGGAGGVGSSGTVPGDDNLASAEAEFDFDSLWNWPGDPTGGGQPGGRFSGVGAGGGGGGGGAPVGPGGGAGGGPGDQAGGTFAGFGGGHAAGHQHQQHLGARPEHEHVIGAPGGGGGGGGNGQGGGMGGMSGLGASVPLYPMTDYT